MFPNRRRLSALLAIALFGSLWVAPVAAQRQHSGLGVASTHLDPEYIYTKDSELIGTSSSYDTTGDGILDTELIWLDAALYPEGIATDTSGSSYEASGVNNPFVASVPHDIPIDGADTNDPHGVRFAYYPDAQPGIPELCGDRRFDGSLVARDSCQGAVRGLRLGHPNTESSVRPRRLFRETRG